MTSQAEAADAIASPAPADLPVSDRTRILIYLSVLVFIIGCCQCLALIPGFSRSGATMAGGYLAGLDHEDAARFSFLTATPIILGAAVLETPKLLHAHDKFSGVAILSGVIAGVVAFLSTVVLMRWFRMTEVRAFDPFALYCALAGAGSMAWLLLR